MRRAPLSVRKGSKTVEEWEGPYDGVPDWIRSYINGWIRDFFVVFPPHVLQQELMSMA